jgi:hypothetical protein
MYCNVIIDSTRYEDGEEIYTMSRACSNYARKGMTCCYSHRKLENDDYTGIDRLWPPIRMMEERISEFDDAEKCYKYVDKLSKRLKYREILQNHFVLLLTFEFAIKFPDYEYKDKENVIKVLLKRVFEAPDHIQEHYLPKLQQLK